MNVEKRLQELEAQLKSQEKRLASQRRLVALVGLLVMVSVTAAFVGPLSPPDPEAVKVTTPNLAGSATTRLQISGNEDTSNIGFMNSKVGIGTASPAEALDVVGNGKISNYVRIGTSTDASAQGAFSAGLTGGRRIYWDVASDVFNINSGATTNVPSLYFNRSTGALGAVVDYRDTAAGAPSDTMQIGTYSSGQIILYSGAFVEAMRIDSSQNLGIGTTSPDQKLTLKSGLFHVASGATLSTTPASTAGFGLFMGTDSGGGESRIQTYSSGGSTFLTFHTNSGGAATAEAMRIDSSQNVGIGTTSPSAKLNVKKDTATAYAGQVPSISDCTGTWINASSGANVLTGFQLNNSGDSQNRISFVGGISESASNRKMSLVFCTDDGGVRTEKVRITGDGLFGIGTTSPSALLHQSSGAGSGLVNRADNTTAGSTSNNVEWDSYLKNSAGSLVEYSYLSVNSETITSGSERTKWSFGSRDAGTFYSPLIILGRNFGIGNNNTQFGSGAGVIGLADAATVPSTNPSGGGVAYSEGGKFKWRRSDGTVDILGVSSSGLELIETKTVGSAVQSVTFSSLNGDTDDTYLITFQIANGSASSTASYVLKPNAVTSNQTNGYVQGHSSGTGYGGNSTLEFAQTTASGWVGGSMIFHAHTGTQRMFSCPSYAYISGYEVSRIYAGRWSDNSTNITSLEINSGITSGIGANSVIKLYRIKR